MEEVKFPLSEEDRINYYYGTAKLGQSIPFEIYKIGDKFYDVYGTEINEDGTDKTDKLEESKSSKQVEIYQVTKNTHDMTFMPWSFIKRNGFSFDNYSMVAELDYEVTDEETDNEIIENIYTYGNGNQWYKDFQNVRSISVSDIIKLDNKYYYIDTIGAVDITSYINNNKLTEDKDDSIFDERDKKIFQDLKNQKEEPSTLDLIQDRIGQEISVGELNTVLQGIFGIYNEIFLMSNMLYNADIDEPQELVVWDDNDMYTITFKIKDLENQMIELTDVEME